MSGPVISWCVDRAEVAIEAAQGDVVDIEGAGPALVTALLRERVVLAPLMACRPGERARAHRRGPLVVAVDDRQIGCTVDCLGEVIDSVRIPVATFAPMFGRDPTVLAPALRRPRLTLGSLVFDLKRVFDAGVSLLALGPRRAFDHVLRHQIAEGRMVVLATPKYVSPEHCAIRRADLPIVHVAAPRDASPAHVWLVPWAAMAIADEHRRRGRDVVVAIDDLDGWRPYVRRFPDRGTWPTQLAALASRVYATERGSVSLLAMTRELDITRAAAFDTAIDLREMMRGEPAMPSTSIVRPPIRLRGKGKLGGAHTWAAQVAELEGYAAAYGDRLDRSTRARLEEGRRMREALRWRDGGPVDSLEQLLVLLAVIHVEELPSQAVGGFIDRYLGKLREHRDRLAAIRTAKQLDEADEKQFLALATQVALSLLPH